MHKKYILAIDQGTTSTRAFLVDNDMNIVASARKEFKQYYPQPGWVEHDPDEIWDTTIFVINEVLRRGEIEEEAIEGIGITNQRETTVLWNRGDGRPVCRAIVWQDRRTAHICEKLIRDGKEAEFSEKTGLVIDPYFSGTKLVWLFENLRGVAEKAERGEIAFGTIDSFLVSRLSGGESHVTDVSNASRTLCMDLSTCNWDAGLLSQLGINKKIMPKIIDSSSIAGVTKGVKGLPDGIPIASIIGDQQAALFGQACFEAGQCKCTYGTGSFLLMNTGDKPVRSKERLLTTVGWKLDGKISYALEASVFVTGAAVQWLRDGLGIIKHSSDVEELAASVPSSDDVVFVPALAGLGAPHWRAHARGMITGLTRGTTAAHIARATLEGIAFQQCDLVASMIRDSGKNITELRVDGGAAANNLMMQIQSDLLGIEIVRPAQIETTVMGAAFLAGLNLGVWKSTQEIAEKWREESRFVPKIDSEEREKNLKKWQDTIRYLL